MDASPTLQDFVLNLIYDPAARSAFELDPEATLQHAGLGDITAADVQQVIPLVVDNTAVTGVTGLAGVDDLTTGVAHLDVAGAVSHLQTITSQVALAPTTGLTDLTSKVTGLNATTVLGTTGDTVLSGNALSGNALGVDGLGLDGLGGLGGVNGVGGVDVGGVNVGGVGDISAVAPVTAPVNVGDLGAVHDPALDLDSNVVAPVDNVVGNLAPATNALLPTTVVGPLGVLDTATHIPSSIDLNSSDLDVAGVHGATSSVGSVVDGNLGGVLSHDPVQHLDSTVASVGDTVHGVTGSLHGTTGLEPEHTPDHGALGGLTDLHF